MATKVFMEALSPTMEEGRLVKWLKNEGDAVKSGESLAEVETDKAIMELVARGDGVLRKRLVGEGESRPVGDLVGVIAAADENIDSLIAGAATSGGGAAAKAPEQVVATTQESAGAPAVPQTQAQSQGEASTPPQQKIINAPPPPPQAPAARGGQPFRNRDDLVGGLTGAEDDFRMALPERPMVIDAGEAEIFERKVSQSAYRRFR